MARDMDGKTTCADCRKDIKTKIPSEDDVQPEQEGSASDIFKKALSYYGVDNFVTDDGLVFKAVIQAMHEFASLREVKMPDRVESLHQIWRDSNLTTTYEVNKAWGEGFDYYESELKRLNNLK
jgi:hypothetical protein